MAFLSSMISTVGHYSCSAVRIYFVFRFKVQADTTICQQPLCCSTGHIRRRTVIYPHRRNETSAPTIIILVFAFGPSWSSSLVLPVCNQFLFLFFLWFLFLNLQVFLIATSIFWHFTRRKLLPSLLVHHSFGSASANLSASAPQTKM